MRLREIRKILGLIVVNGTRKKVGASAPTTNSLLKSYTLDSQHPIWIHMLEIFTLRPLQFVGSVRTGQGHIHLYAYYIEK